MILVIFCGFLVCNFLIFCFIYNLWFFICCVFLKILLFIIIRILFVFNCLFIILILIFLMIFIGKLFVLIFKILFVCLIKFGVDLIFKNFVFVFCKFIIVKFNVVNIFFVVFKERIELIDLIVIFLLMFDWSIFCNNFIVFLFFIWVFCLLFILLLIVSVYLLIFKFIIV